MAYTKELREKVLSDINSGVPIGKISRTYQISVPTLYNWKNKYLVGNDSSLETVKEKEKQLGESTPQLIHEKEDSLQHETKEDTKNILNIEEWKIMPINVVCGELKTLMKSGKLEEVVETINQLPSKDNPMVISLKVKSLYLLGKRNQDIERIKKAYENCLKLQNNQVFQDYMQKIESEFKEIDWSHFKIKEEEELPKSLTSPQQVRISPIKENSQKEVIKELITKIYCDFITAPEIEKASIDTWYKDLLILALTHKRSREHAIVLGKKLQEKYKEDEQKLKIANKLLECIKNKKGINFDVNNYTTYLPAGVDFSLAEEFFRKKALLDQKVKEVKTWAQNLQVATPMVEKAKISRKPEKRIIGVEGKPVTARYQQVSSSTQISSKTTNRAPQIIKNLKIKDFFESEMFAIGKLLYVQMQSPRNVKRGCRAWDTLENLKEKSATDECAIRSALSLIERLDIKTNDERNDKIYQELEERRNKRMKEHEEKVKKI